jgi:hypothetical protein
MWRFELLLLRGSRDVLFFCDGFQPMSLSTASAESIGLRPASQIMARPVDWLWPGRLPLSKLAMAILE